MAGSIREYPFVPPASGSGAPGPAGPAGAAGTGATTERKTVLTANIMSKSVTLANTPGAPTLTRLWVIGGALQNYGTDFAIEGNVLSWANLGTERLVEVGDILIVEY